MRFFFRTCVLLFFSGRYLVKYSTILPLFFFKRNFYLVFVCVEPYPLFSYADEQKKILQWPASSQDELNRAPLPAASVTPCALGIVWPCLKVPPAWWRFRGKRRWCDHLISVTFHGLDGGACRWDGVFLSSRSGGEAGACPLVWRGWMDGVVLSC